MAVEDLDRLEHASREITADETRRSLALWFGVLGSPLAWAAHLVVNYSLEEWFACSPSATDRGEVLGFGVDTVSIAFNSAMLAVAAASGLVAYSCWRRLRSQGDDHPPGDEDRAPRARWMAFVGWVEGILFVAIILLGYLPPLTLGTCEAV